MCTSNSVEPPRRRERRPRTQHLGLWFTEVVSGSRRLVFAGLSFVLLLLVGVGLVATPAGGAVVQAIVRRGSATIAPLLARLERPPSSVVIDVDPARVIRPINPLIYGVSVTSPNELTALGARLNRWGGNPNTRYNWALGNAWNAARDWEFRNYGQDGSEPSPAPMSASDRFVAANRALKVETELTVPAIGWVARNGDKETRSLNVPAAGGPPLGVLSEAIAGYDPTDNRARTSVSSIARKGAPFVDQPVRAGRVYQDEWINHLVKRFGPAGAGGVRYYAIDNEPDLWSSTHTDVRPVQPSYDEMLAIFIEYAEAIKAVDPNAQVLGPTLSGWTGYFFSPRDEGPDRFRTHADRRAHGDMPFLPWWLDQVRQNDELYGTRSLDVLDVHYYPQAPGVYGAADDETTRGLRLRSTRSLWDPTYADESWIAEPVRLIPRLREWVDQYYPGTLLAVGEWNWGGENSMSGALAVADVLGIFGREGVDMAAYWTRPPLGSPAATAFTMYTNYDGRGHGFGDCAVATRVNASPDYVTAYASTDASTADVLVIAINKRPDVDMPATIRLSGAVGHPTESFRFAPGDKGAVQDVGRVIGAGSELSLVLPPSSITLVRITLEG
jgi:hypothetical protein